MKYYNITVEGPFCNTSRHYSFEVADDFDPEGKDEETANSMLEDSIFEYTEAYGKVEDEPKD